MIDVSDAARSVLASSSINYRVAVQSWLGDELLADDVPVSAGSETADRSLAVPDRATFTVPARAGGMDWTPNSDDHPLAANGQTLKVSLGIGLGPDGVEWFQRGELLIDSSVVADDGLTVTVNAVGLMSLIDEAKFVSPFQPTGNMTNTVRSLLEPAVAVNLDLAPADRAVPASSINWDSDRLAAFGEVLDAWAADWRMNELGYVEIVPAADPTVADVVRSFTNGTRGTIVASVGSSSRDGGFNVVVATGTASDGGQVLGVAYVRSGPWAYGIGPANPLPVPFGYSSPLLTTQAQCTAAAQTVLARKMRAGVLRRFQVTAVPDPTIQLGDPVLVTNDYVTDLLCTVEALDPLPYFPAPMVLEVVEVSTS
jgi:hypothetical protein